MAIMVPISWAHWKDVVEEHLRNPKPRVANGSTKKEAELNEAIWRAERAQRFEELARLATSKRIAKMTILFDADSEEERKYIDRAGAWDAQRWLNDIEVRWISGEWKDVEDDAFYTQIHTSFFEQVVNADGWHTRYNAYRRQLILEGKLVPEERDQKWLIEERESLAAVVNPYDAALAKLQTSGK